MNTERTPDMTNATPARYDTPAETVEAPAPIGHNKPPRKQWKGRPRVCVETGETFTPHHPKARFSSAAAQKAYHNRAHKRGGPLMPLLQAWYRGRNSKDPATRKAAMGAFAELCRQAQEANLEDRTAGRPDPVEAYRQLQALQLNHGPYVGQAKRNHGKAKA